MSGDASNWRRQSPRREAQGIDSKCESRRERPARAPTQWGRRQPRIAAEGRHAAVRKTLPEHRGRSARGRQAARSDSPLDQGGRGREQPASRGSARRPCSARSKSVTAGLRVARRCESVGTHADLRQGHPSRPAPPVARTSQAARRPSARIPPSSLDQAAKAGAVKPPRGALFSPRETFMFCSPFGAVRKNANCHLEILPFAFRGASRSLRPFAQAFGRRSPVANLRTTSF